MAENPSYQPGQKVWLFIRMRLPCKKLSPRYVGTFTIINQINPVTFQLQLPSQYKIHSSFHVSLLKPYHPPFSVSTEPGPTEEPPLPLIQEDGAIYMVNEILEYYLHAPVWNQHFHQDSFKSTHITYFSFWPSFFDVNSLYAIQVIHLYTYLVYLPFVSSPVYSSDPRSNVCFSCYFLVDCIITHHQMCVLSPVSIPQSPAKLGCNLHLSKNCSIA